MKNMSNRKRIGIWGSTGSIGTQALEVIRQFPDRFEIIVLTCGTNAPLLIKQAIEFKPRYVVIGDETRYSEVKIAVEPLGIKVLAGRAALTEMAGSDEYDMMLAALVGAVGLEPTLAAIESGKDIALANKETLVVAGELVMGMVKKHGVRLLPVDSEHSAIFQALHGSRISQVEKVILTASGGPFLGKASELEHGRKNFY
jgi:1-deoxy-D-xylulose-5-phosphate reductoisomerase